MIYLLVVLHIIVCLFLIGVVLLQQGKSADLAGAFGGQGSQTAFGPRGAANLLTKLTTWGAVHLHAGLHLADRHAGAHQCGDHSVLSGTPAQQTTPKK
jgi:preprotein translocase subunit SecG